VDGYEPSTYGERFADVYDDWYRDVTDVSACVERLAGLVADAGGGPVLELGVGTGRLALPLAARGVEVHGIDASAAMLDRLRAKPGGDAVHLTEGDMAALDLADPPPFAVVFVAFNTFFNLGTQDAQQRCLARVATLLAPGGTFVLEGFVPAAPEDGGERGAVTPRRITTDEVQLTVSQHDPVAQTITGQHVHITEAGIRLRPWHLRYATPDELDAMADRAGLTPAWRHADWAGRPFGPDATVHVSGYHRGIVRDVRPPGSPAT
jgi:SAM-dependent methyltransferase